MCLTVRPVCQSALTVAPDEDADGTLARSLNASPFDAPVITDIEAVYTSRPA